MAFINQISEFINVLLTVLIIGTLIVAGLAYYFLKVRKVMSKQEVVDYTRFERRNSTEFVKFDNIISGHDFGRGEEEGLIVTDNDTTFTAGVQIQGYSFFNASAEEQRDTMIGMMNLLQALEAPIQLRQSSKAIDISFIMDKYTARRDELKEEVTRLGINFEEMSIVAQDFEDVPDKLAYYTKELAKLRREIETKDRMVEECEVQMEWLNTIADAQFDTQTVSTLYVSWHFNPNDYVQELNKEEVYLKAFSELSTKIDILGAAFARCQCTIERLSARDIVDQIRRHYHPVTSDTVMLEDLVNTSLDSLYISSDSLMQLQKQAMDDEAFRQMMLSIEDDRVDAVDRVDMNMQSLKEKTENEVMEAFKDYDPYAQYATPVEG